MTDRAPGPPEVPGFVPLPDQPFGEDNAPKARPAQPGQAKPPQPAAPAPPAEQKPQQPTAGPSSTGPSQGPPRDHAGRPVLCPYCASAVTNPARCDACRGLLDPLSRQASQNTMGPWALLDPERPGMPGMSFETLRRLVERGRVGRDSVVRGPTTRQFWVRADHAPGVAVLLGACHACKSGVGPHASSCPACGAELHTAPGDRQHLGLIEARDLPGAPPTQPTASTPSPVRAPDAGAPPTASALDAAGARKRARVLGVLCVLLVVAVFLVSGLWMWDSLHERGVKIDLPGVVRNTPANTPPPTTANLSTNAGATAAPNTATDPATTTEPPAVEPAGDEPIDAALTVVDPGLEEWHPDLRRAYALEAEGTLASVERAVQLVEGVLREAGDASSFPMVSAWLGRLRDRVDVLFAESVLGG